MQSKIMQVFYGNDCLPYKDKERQVHYPITGSAFLGASNTTEIRFYIERIGNEDDTWVANAKLPNGKMGNKLLEKDYDNVVGEYYAKLQLSSFYTQAKGDVYISLNGFSGNVDIDYDEMNDLYTINGIPTIQATGCVKLAINYATPLIDGEEVETITLAQILDEVGNKVSKNSGYYLKVVYNIENINNPEYEDYLTGNDIVYSKADKTFYKLSGVFGSLTATEIELDLESLIANYLVVGNTLRVNGYEDITDGINTLTDYIADEIDRGISSYFTMNSNPMSLSNGQYNALYNNNNFAIKYNNEFYLKGSTSGTSDIYYSILDLFIARSGYVDKEIKTITLTHSTKKLEYETQDISFYNKSQMDTLLNGKQNTLTFDNTPTSGSNNPVISSGIKSALDTKQNTLVAGNGITISGNVISASGAVQFEIVEELPASGASNVIYLLPLEDSEEDNVYEEYIWVNNDWEMIGTTNVDLSDYYTKSEANALLNQRVSDTFLNANEYDNTQTYSVGDLCVYNGKLYKCTSAISTPTDFDVGSWTEITVADYVDLTSNQTITGAKTFSALNLSNDMNAGDQTITNVYSMNVKTVNFSNTILPNTDNSKSIGSNSRRIKDLYLSGRFSDGNNANYGLTLPNTTSYTANKTIATTDDLSSKQDTLVSGTNIKTINNASVLGSGNLVVGNVSYEIYVDRTLNNNDWNTIRLVCEAGLASNYWSVGDTKTDVGTDNVVRTFRIVDMSGLYGKHVVFEEVGLEGSGVALDINGFSNNYSTSTMNTTTLPATVLLLSSELQAELTNTTVKVATDGETATLLDVSSKLFLAAEKEVTGTRTYSRTEEFDALTTYSYYVTHNTNADRVKKDSNNTAQHWWLRSPRSGNAYGACFVLSDGSLGNGSVAISYRFAPCFAF